ncbi:MAG: hypothetical protein OEV89_05740 [Desulfobulbaceae bacterium]|nr:hypothetical protein [Desulfobulbaceae bacterium]HIJ90253.1 hypothetical protein [Deltaproteobacteria bacterium]
MANQRNTGFLATNRVVIATQILTPERKNVKIMTDYPISMPENEHETFRQQPCFLLDKWLTL